MSDRLAQACAQFEALILKQMLADAGLARTTALGGGEGLDEAGGGAPSGGSGADIVQSLFVETLAQTVADADRTGLGHMLETRCEGYRNDADGREWTGLCA